MCIPALPSVDAPDFSTPFVDLLASPSWTSRGKCVLVSDVDNCLPHDKFIRDAQDTRQNKRDDKTTPVTLLDHDHESASHPSNRLKGSPMLIREVLLVVRDAPLSMNRAPSADDARQAVGSVRNKRQQHSRVDGEIIHALLCLFNKSVSKDLPRQIFGNAANLRITLTW